MKEQIYEISKLATAIDPVSQSELENGVAPTEEETAERMNLFLNYSSKQLFSVSKELQNFIEAQGLTLNELDNTQLEQAMNAFALSKIYPIGSIYMSVINTNPASFFGGTWEVWGTGRVAVGVDTGQTEFDTVEKTGGEKTHTLSVNEMPSHDHQITSSYKYATGDDSAYDPHGVYTGGITQASGGGLAHNNLQPYITCYMWKRTS